MEFSFIMPTQVFFGEKCIIKHCNEFRKYGKKPLIVTGKTSALKSGAFDDVKTVLSDLSMSYTLYNSVLPNPDIDNVRDAAKIARDVKADMIIGIGGGSPLDAAKAVAVLAVTDRDNESLFTKPFIEKPLPVIAIPTTSGTGSEVTPYSILTDVKNRTKRNLSHTTLYPKAAFLDPSYTASLPYDITVNTAMDAFSHAVESCLSQRATSMSIMYAMESLKYLSSCLFNFHPNTPVTMEQRTNLLYASMLAGIAIAQTGTTVVHAMGYSLTFFKNADHGNANGRMLSEYLKYVTPYNPEKIQRIMAALGIDKFEKVTSMIERLSNTFPLKVSEEEIQLFSEMAVVTKSVENTSPVPNIEDIKRIFKQSLRS